MFFFGPAETIDQIKWPNRCSVNILVLSMSLLSPSDVESEAVTAVFLLMALVIKV